MDKTIIQNFIKEQDINQTSRRTYASALEQFMTWLQAKGLNYENITRADILDYKAYILNDRKAAAATAGLYIVVIRRFYKWISKPLYYEAIDGIKGPRRQQRHVKQHLNDDEVKDLTNSLTNAGNARNYAIVTLMLYGALRCIEVARADTGDIQTRDGRTILRIQGKGHAERDNFIVLHPAALRAIREYQQERQDLAPTSPLFTSESRRNAGGRLTTRTISGICKKAMRAVGIDSPEFTAHSLRHTAAVKILQTTGNIYAVKRVLRHANIKTSEIYTQSIEEEERIKDAPELLIRYSIK